MRLKNPIKVMLRGKMKMYFTDIAPKGTPVVVDRIGGSPASKNYIMVRVVILWKRPDWIDAGWVKFD
uniref:Uncharacterized protein n=1 Tax=viral metagenome TaxID=1070528 RepID=A0A6M3LIV5_9ZZZZ